MPRRLITPRTCGGMFGNGVNWVRPMISCTLRISRPYRSSPRLKVRYWREAPSAEKLMMSKMLSYSWSSRSTTEGWTVGVEVDSSDMGCSGWLEM